MWQRKRSAPRVSDRDGSCRIYYNVGLQGGYAFIEILFNEAPERVHRKGSFTRRRIWLRDLQGALEKAKAQGKPFTSGILKCVLPADKDNPGFVIAILRREGILQRIGPPGSYRSVVVKSVAAYERELRDRQNRHYEESVVSLFVKNGIAGHTLLSSLPRDLQLEEEIKRVRNSLAAHIDTKAELAVLQKNFLSLDLGTVHTYFINLINCFLQGCRMDIRTRPYSITSTPLEGVDEMQRSPSIKPFDD